MKTATNPETGEKAFLINNEWATASQSATNEAGEKAYLVNGEWVTPEQDLVAEEEAYDPLAIENIAGSAAEPLMHLGTGLFGSAVGGLAGLGAIGAKKLGYDVDPAGVIKDVSGALTYEPKTEGGKIATDVVTYPFQKLAEGAEYAGGKTLKATGSPALATVVDAAIKMSPMLIGVKGKPAGSPKFKHAPKQRQLLEDVVTAPVRVPAKAAGKGIKTVVDAVRSRLPGGSKKVAEGLVYELANKSPQGAAAVQKAMMEAKKGETAGQAASGTGSHEIAAMQKVADYRAPSDYGAIAAAQMAKKAKDLQMGATPELIAAAEKTLAKSAEKAYAPTRNQVVDMPFKVVERPVFESAFKKAKENAKNSGEPFPKTITEPMTVQQLQAVKIEASKSLQNKIDSLGEKPSSGEVRSVSKATDEFLTALRDPKTGSKEFAIAEDAYAAQIRPINQAKTGQELSKAIKPDLGAKEQSAAFMSKKGKLEKEGKLKELEPEQRAVIDNVIKDLDKSKLLEEQAISGARSLDSILGTKYGAQLVNPLYRPIMVINAILKRIEGKNTGNTLDYITQKFKDPAAVAQMIKNATPKEMAILKEATSKGHPIISAGIIQAAEER